MPDVLIAGATYSDVPAVELPLVGGGIARFVVDSGGQGVKTESGSFSPETAIVRPKIEFSDEHDEAPYLIILSDSTGTAFTTTGTVHHWIYFDMLKRFGSGVPYTSTGFRYAVVWFAFRGTATTSLSTNVLWCSYRSTSSGDASTSYPRYFATEEEFYPYANTDDRKFRPGRTYSWEAFWM